MSSSRRSDSRRDGHDVFVSYSIVDQELAVAIADKLQAEGLSCFLAPKSIALGELWADRIRAELQLCSCLVVLLSPNSIKSEWVTTEWGAAWSLGKAIVPVLHQCDTKDIPSRLASLQVCDYHQFPTLISRVATLVSSARVGATVRLELAAVDIQPALKAICEDAEDRIRLFLHVLGPPKITDDLAHVIARRVAERKSQPRPLRFSPVLALDFDNIPVWFWPTFDKRNEIYAEADILNLTAGRFFRVATPSGLDIVIVDSRHVLFMATTVDGASGNQVGILIRNAPSLAEDYAEWFDSMVWAHAVPRSSI